VQTPPAQWEQAFRAMGFSEPAAKSYVEMTRLTLEEAYEPAHAPKRGAISMDAYVAALVKKSSD